MALVGEQKLSICLLGDVSLNGFWERSDVPIFSQQVIQLIQSHDVVLMNLESPVRGDGEENELKTPRLGTSERAVERLRSLVPTVCVLGNNHIYDHLELGFSRTKSAVELIGAATVGAGLDSEEAARPYRFEVKGVPISVLSYVGGETNPMLPEDASVRINMVEEERIVEDVHREKSLARYVIVSIHWGLEFFMYPAPWQRRLARRIAKAGASVVWGHHAHVCQGWERFGSTAVFYSMGNSVFDNVEDKVIWNEGGRRSLLACITMPYLDQAMSIVDVRCLQRPSCSETAELARVCWRDRMLCWPLKLGLRCYQAFYQAEVLRMFVRRGWEFVFGEGRNPLVQVLRLPSRLLGAFGSGRAVSKPDPESHQEDPGS